MFFIILPFGFIVIALIVGVFVRAVYVLTHPIQGGRYYGYKLLLFVLKAVGVVGIIAMLGGVVTFSKSSIPLYILELVVVVAAFTLANRVERHRATHQ